MKREQTIYILTLVLSLSLLAFNSNAQIATVDGDISEWNLVDDFFYNMHRAGKLDKKIETKVYLRWICPEKVLYLLVLQADSTIPILKTNPDDQTWVKINGDKKVHGNSGDDGTPPDFAWVGSNIDSAQGWEASIQLDDNVTPYSISIHNNVWDEDESQTARVDTTLLLDCSNPLPVELTSFSATAINNLAQLNWETESEVNNFGFEIQRSTISEIWSKVGFVSGQGNSSSPKQYSFTDNTISKSDKYNFRLKQIDIDGGYEYSNVVNVSINIPEIEYKLKQNYPNPFNPKTVISYTIPEKSNVKLIVYNIFGEEIARLVNESKEAGNYSVNFIATNIASGIYFYTLQTDNFSSTKKLILLK